MPKTLFAIKILNYFQKLFFLPTEILDPGIFTVLLKHPIIRILIKIIFGKVAIQKLIFIETIIRLIKNEFDS
jgi:hypothetical protein